MTKSLMGLRLAASSRHGRSGPDHAEWLDDSGTGCRRHIVQGQGVAELPQSVPVSMDSGIRSSAEDVGIVVLRVVGRLLMLWFERLEAP
jgi:hypothetical protein